MNARFKLQQAALQTANPMAADVATLPANTG
jgi:hypothetical protein